MGKIGAQAAARDNTDLVQTKNSAGEGACAPQSF
jgi:hypothetical protein